MNGNAISAARLLSKTPAAQENNKASCQPDSPRPMKNAVGCLASRFAFG